MSVFEKIRLSAKKLNQFDPELAPPYRDVIGRRLEGDTEHITLKCGHELILKHQRIKSFPCSECEPERAK